MQQIKRKLLKDYKLYILENATQIMQAASVSVMLQVIYWLLWYKGETTLTTKMSRTDAMARKLFENLQSDLKSLSAEAKKKHLPVKEVGFLNSISIVYSLKMLKSDVII